jgi:hypothetical protein
MLLNKLRGSEKVLASDVFSRGDDIDWFEKPSETEFLKHLFSGSSSSKKITKKSSLLSKVSAETLCKRDHVDEVCRIESVENDVTSSDIRSFFRNNNTYLIIYYYFGKNS